jgi:hypothetical protein
VSPCYLRKANKKMKIEDLRQNGKKSLYWWREIKYNILFLKPENY